MKAVVTALVLMLLSGHVYAVSDADIRVAVVDDDGEPVSGVTVRGYFTNMRYDFKPGPENSGMTDVSGVVSISGPALLSVGVEARKSGYYMTRTKVVVNKNRSPSVSLVLRPKTNPVGMYAKDLTLEFPKADEILGFDLFEGDLVGVGFKGKVADINIAMSREVAGDNRFSQTAMLKMPNAGDGLVVASLDKTWSESEYKTGYMAPSDGYAPDFEVTFAQTENGYERKHVGTPLYLRARTKLDPQGNIESAHYCKVFPGVTLYGVLAETQALKMTYYCNSTSNDRNVEFDVNKNLFKNLTRHERVQTP